MASLNKCEFIGNLGKDPEIRYTTDGKAVASFSIACTESWKDKQKGEKKEKTEWINISAFGKLAEIMGQYLKKGSKVYIAGKMTTDEYEKDGVKRYSTKIIAQDMIMLDSISNSGRNETQGKTQHGADDTQSVPAMTGDDFDDFSDSIPF